jgi:hypothetical protein
MSSITGQFKYQIEDLEIKTATFFLGKNDGIIYVDNFDPIHPSEKDNILWLQNQFCFKLVNNIEPNDISTIPIYPIPENFNDLIPSYEKTIEQIDDDNPNGQEVIKQKVWLFHNEYPVENTIEYIKFYVSEVEEDETLSSNYQFFSSNDDLDIDNLENMDDLVEYSYQSPTIKINNIEISIKKSGDSSKYHGKIHSITETNDFVKFTHVSGNDYKYKLKISTYDTILNNITNIDNELNNTITELNSLCKLIACNDENDSINTYILSYIGGNIPSNKSITTELVNNIKNICIELKQILNNSKILYSPSGEHPEYDSLSYYISPSSANHIINSEHSNYDIKTIELALEILENFSFEENNENIGTDKINYTNSIEEIILFPTNTISTTLSNLTITSITQQSDPDIYTIIVEVDYSNQILNSIDNIPYLWYRLSGDASLPDLCDYELVQSDFIASTGYSNIFTWTFDVTFPSLDTTTGVNNNPNLKIICLTENIILDQSISSDSITENCPDNENKVNVITNFIHDSGLTINNNYTIWYKLKNDIDNNILETDDKNQFGYYKKSEALLLNPTEDSGNYNHTFELDELFFKYQTTFNNLTEYVENSIRIIEKYTNYIDLYYKSTLDIRRCYINKINHLEIFFINSYKLTLGKWFPNCDHTCLENKLSISLKQLKYNSNLTVIESMLNNIRIIYHIGDLQFEIITILGNIFDKYKTSTESININNQQDICDVDQSDTIKDAFKEFLPELIDDINKISNYIVFNSNKVFNNTTDQEIKLVYNFINSSIGSSGTNNELVFILPKLDSNILNLNNNFINLYNDFTNNQTAIISRYELAKDILESRKLSFNSMETIIDLRLKSIIDFIQYTKNLLDD